jgi:hypothetical protein
MNQATMWECPQEYTIGGQAELIMRELRRNTSFAGLDLITPNKESAARGRANAARVARGRFGRRING